MAFAALAVSVGIMGMCCLGLEEFVAVAEDRDGVPGFALDAAVRGPVGVLDLVDDVGRDGVVAFVVALSGNVGGGVEHDQVGGCSGCLGAEEEALSDGGGDGGGVEGDEVALLEVPGRFFVGELVSLGECCSVADGAEGASDVVDADDVGGEGGGEGGFARGDGSAEDEDGLPGGEVAEVGWVAECSAWAVLWEGLLVDAGGSDALVAVELVAGWLASFEVVASGWGGAVVAGDSGGASAGVAAAVGCSCVGSAVVAPVGAADDVVVGEGVGGGWGFAADPAVGFFA